MFEEPKAMREIHEIMEKIYEKDKAKGPAEILDEIHHSNEQLLREKGLKLEIIRGSHTRVPVSR